MPAGLFVQCNAVPACVLLPQQLQHKLTQLASLLWKYCLGQTEAVRQTALSEDLPYNPQDRDLYALLLDLRIDTQ